MVGGSVGWVNGWMRFFFLFVSTGGGDLFRTSCFSKEGNSGRPNGVFSIILQ